MNITIIGDGGWGPPSDCCYTRTDTGSRCGAPSQSISTRYAQAAKTAATCPASPCPMTCAGSLIRLAR